MPHTTKTELVQIGTMAERIGLSLRTVRYYEEMGLVEPTTRTKGGFRLYGPEQEERLRVIKAMKPLGFTLEQMREFIVLLDGASRARAGSRRASLILQQINDVQQEIDLRRVNLMSQVEATTQITSALDSAKNNLT